MSPDKMSRTKCRGQNVAGTKCRRTKCRGQNVVDKMSRTKCRGQNVAGIQRETKCRGHGTAANHQRGLGQELKTGGKGSCCRRFWTGCNSSLSAYIPSCSRHWMHISFWSVCLEKVTVWRFIRKVPRRAWFCPASQMSSRPSICSSCRSYSNFWKFNTRSHIPWPRCYLRLHGG